MRPLHNSTIRTRYDLTSAYMQDQTHSEWYTMLHSGLRDEIDHESHEYEREELEALERAAEILKAKQ